MIIEPLSLHAIAVMVFTIIGLYLFSRDWIPIETTAVSYTHLTLPTILLV